MPEKPPKPVPDGMHTITVHLWFKGNCQEAIHFYKNARLNGSSRLSNKARHDPDHAIDCN